MFRDLFKSKIHQNKDWNFRTKGRIVPSASVFKSKIHQNKDWNLLTLLYLEIYSKV